MLTRPLAGALLASPVQDHINKSVACFFVFHGKNITGDLNQITVKLAPVPFGKDIVECIVIQSQAIL